MDPDRHPNISFSFGGMTWAPDLFEKPDNTFLAVGSTYINGNSVNERRIGFFYSLFQRHFEVLYSLCFFMLFVWGCVIFSRILPVVEILMNDG